MRTRHFLIILLALSIQASAQEGPITTGHPKGSLIVIGGGRVDQEIMQEFIDLASGEEARIVVIPTAGEGDFNQDESLRKGLEDYFRDYGIEEITILHTRDTARANMRSFVKPLETATGVYFMGGRQWRIADGFLNTRAHDELFKLLDRGGVIAGSSAGATIQGSYLARGDTRNNQIMMGDHQEGLGFISAVAIDQHVLARNRQFDLFTILKERPDLLGIGIDESTAIVVMGDECEVVGSSYVLFYDGSFWSREGSSLKNLPPPASQFYMLKAGDRYNLRLREVIRK